MKIYVNNKEIEANPQDTILKAVEKVGIKIPTLCHLKDLSPTGACRVCVVEVEGFNTLVPSCSFPVSEGMRIHTHTPKAINARKTILELLLARHPDDCFYCVRNGNCELSSLAKEYNITKRMEAVKSARRKYMDISSPSIIRDPDKCILCGKCVRVCEEVQGVGSIDFINRGSNTYVGCAFDKNLNVSTCVNCGQCIAVCPTGALTENSHVKDILSQLSKKDKTIVAQIAPAVSVSIAEEFGMKPGIDINKVLIKALRKLGFDKVFETSYSADLTIMEEASELVHRIKTNGKFPMFTSCSPAWIKFVEQFYPDMIDNLSSCKSPQQMLGALIKSYYAEKENIKPEDIYSVSIMPCTAKKFEASRPEMSNNMLPDIDAVLTTRELAQLLKLYSIDLNENDTSEADLPFGERSTAGKIFGTSGGVMEAAIRTAYYLVTGKDLEELKIQSIRGLEGRKEVKINIEGTEYGFAVVSGLLNARKLLDEIKNGRNDIHFIEVMSCPGGCINGGGQPLGKDNDAIKARMQSLYNIDGSEKIRTSHSNMCIQQLYKEYLKEPLGKKSHKLLHTKYKVREEVL